MKSLLGPLFVVCSLTTAHELDLVAQIAQRLEKLDVRRRAGLNALAGLLRTPLPRQFSRRRAGANTRARLGPNDRVCEREPWRLPAWPELDEVATNAALR